MVWAVFFRKKSKHPQNSIGKKFNKEVNAPWLIFFFAHRNIIPPSNAATGAWVTWVDHPCIDDFPSCFWDKSQKRLLPWLSEDLATTWGFCPVLERWFSYVFFMIIQDFWGLKMVPRHSPTQFQLDPLKKHQLTFISISTLSSSKLFLKKITSKTFLQIASSKPDCSKLFGSFEGLISS